MSANNRKNLLARIVTHGGDDPLLLRLVAPEVIRTGVAATGIALVGQGGAPNYVFSIVTGSLPTGLSLNGATGAITGTPTTPGTYAFVAQIQDSTASVYTASFSITVFSRLIRKHKAIRNGEVGIPYVFQFKVSGNTGSVTWSLASGNFPAGLTLNTATGVLSGTPTADSNGLGGTSYFTVRATDGGRGETLDMPDKIRVYEEMSGPAAVSDVEVDAGSTSAVPGYARFFHGGVPPLSIEVSIPSQISGWTTYNAQSGVITTSPPLSEIGNTYNVQFTARDAIGNSVSENLGLVIVQKVKEAPENGTIYGRKDGSWTPVPFVGVSTGASGVSVSGSPVTGSGTIALGLGTAAAADSGDFDAAGTAASAVSAHASASGAHDADNIDYDNSTSGLSATDVQAAIDEIAAGGGGGGGGGPYITGVAHDADEGDAYSWSPSLHNVGGATTVRWEVTEGYDAGGGEAVPGAFIDANTGEVSGTLTGNGYCNFEIAATLLDGAIAGATTYSRQSIYVTPLIDVWSDTVSALSPLVWITNTDADETAQETAGNLGSAGGTVDSYHYGKETGVFLSPGIMPSNVTRPTIYANTSNKIQFVSLHLGTGIPLGACSVYFAFKSAGAPLSASIPWRDTTSVSGGVAFIRFDGTYCTIRVGGSDKTTTLLNSDVLDGDAHLIGVEFTGSAVELWFDGAKVWSTSASQSGTASEWTYMKNGANAQGLNGYFGDFLIFGPLSDTEHGDLYNAWQFGTSP